MTRDLDRMIRKAQRMEKRVEELRKELGKRTFDGSAQGVVASVNGDHQVLSLKIPPEMVNPEETSRLEKLVLEAVNDALTKSKLVIDREMRRATNELDMVSGMNSSAPSRSYMTGRTCPAI